MALTEYDWMPHVSPHAADEVFALLEAATVADGVSPVSDPVRVQLRSGPGAGTSGQEPTGWHLLWRETDGPGPGAGSTGERAPLVGYAFCGSDGVAEFVVHPEARGRGVGGSLARAVLDRDHDRLWAWAHGQHPAAMRLAQRHGAAVERELWRMGLVFADYPEVETPDFPADVTVRSLRVGEDEPDVITVNGRAFSWHPEQGEMSAAELAQLEGESWFDADGFLLAERDSELLGFHWTKVHAVGPSGPGVRVGDPMGEVYVIGVDPAAQGMGLGKALTLAGLRYLRQQREVPAVMLFVEGDNPAAIGLYRRLGFEQWDVDALLTLQN